MQVHQLPSDPGPAAWNNLLEEAHPRPALTSAIHADCLVIGAGFAGLSAARQIIQHDPSQKVVVLDASRVAFGPAGRNSGFMIDVPHDLSSDDYGKGEHSQDQHEIEINRTGIRFALDVKESFNLSDEALVMSGKINGALTERGLQHNNSYASYLDQLSETYERLDAASMRAVTGSNAYIDGLYSPGTAMLQPALYIRGLAHGIEQYGVQLFEQSPVLSLQPCGPDWQVLTPEGSVIAPRVVLTVNGHLESFGYYSRHLVHIYTYASMTRALTAKEVEVLGGEPRWAITPADPLGTTVRRISGTGGDRIIIRNRATYDPSMKVSVDRLNRISNTHDNSFTHRFPQLASVAMEYRWGGRLCLSLNSVPVFGEIDSGLFAACCQNGLGTAKGSAYGKLIADKLCGLHSDLQDKIDAYAQPTRLPPKPIASLGANLKLRWSEFRAGKEL